MATKNYAVKETANGAIRYTLNGKPVAAKNVPESAKQKLSVYMAMAGFGKTLPGTVQAKSSSPKRSPKRSPKKSPSKTVARPASPAKALQNCEELVAKLEKKREKKKLWKKRYLDLTAKLVKINANLKNADTMRNRASSPRVAAEATLMEKQAIAQLSGLAAYHSLIAGVE